MPKFEIRMTPNVTGGPIAGYACLILMDGEVLEGCTSYEISTDVNGHVQVSLTLLASDVEITRTPAAE